MVNFWAPNFFKKKYYFSFLLGAIPWLIWEIVWTSNAGINDCRTFYIFHVTHTIVYGFLRVSETLNPIIYILGSENLKKSVKTIFGLGRTVAQPVPVWARCSKLNTVSSEGISESET